MKKPLSPRKLKQKTTGETRKVKVHKDTKNHKELKNKNANKKQKTKANQNIQKIGKN